MCRISKYELVCEKVATYSADINKRLGAEFAEQNALCGAFDVAELLLNVIRTDRNTTEHFYVFCLDTKLKVIGFFDIARGNLDSCPVHPREVFQPVVATAKCSAVIVAHNHPSGDPTPSPEDIEITKRLIEAGNLLGIRVIDHLVVGDGLWESIRSMDVVKF